MCRNGIQGSWPESECSVVIYLWGKVCQLCNLVNSALLWSCDNISAVNRLKNVLINHTFSKINRDQSQLIPPNINVFKYTFILQ